MSTSHPRGYSMLPRRLRAWCLWACLGILAYNSYGNYDHFGQLSGEWQSNRQTSHVPNHNNHNHHQNDPHEQPALDTDWDMALPVALRTLDPSTFDAHTHNLAFTVHYIGHYPRQHKIVVHLQPNRTACQAPVLMGRLSGAYLGMIHWQQDDDEDSDDTEDGEDTTIHNNNNNNNNIHHHDHHHHPDQVVGYYSVRQPGRYNIEILGLACERVTPHTNLKTRCLQDPHHHRLTHDNAHIFIRPLPKTTTSSSARTTSTDTTTSSLLADDDDQHQHHSRQLQQRMLHQQHRHLQLLHQQTNALLGFWKNTNHPEGKNNHNNNHLPMEEPLHTRYQPSQCRERTERDSPRCTRRMSEERFRPYAFEFRQQHHTAITSPIGHLQRLALSLPTKLKSNNNHHHSICALGWSHSRVLVEHAMPLLVQAGLNQTIQLVHIGARFPEEITPDFVEEQRLAHECDMIIVGLFQWPLAGRKTPPTGALYRRRMQQVLRVLQDHLSPEALIFVRSGHYNPLGDWISSCPAKDLRSPVNVQLFNKMLQQTVEAEQQRNDDNNKDIIQQRVHYVDTNSIVQPLWDSAHDWNHYSGKVSDTEAWYILQQVLQVAGQRR